MRNSLILFLGLSCSSGAKVSEKVAKLSDLYCEKAPQLTRMDPDDAKVTHLFVGDENVLATVCDIFSRHMDHI